MARARRIFDSAESCRISPLDATKISVPRTRRLPSDLYASIFAIFALDWMNDLRAETSSPMSTLNARSAWAASSIVTCLSTRALGSIVVSQSSSGFISPRPLYLWRETFTSRFFAFPSSASASSSTVPSSAPPCASSAISSKLMSLPRNAIFSSSLYA